MSPSKVTGAEQIRSIIGAAPEMTDSDTWPEPDMRLLNDDRPPAPALDDDALPASWGSWITAEATARACPRDYVAAGLIGATSSWIGNARRITATTDWHEPANVWFALIGAPSTGKTPALQPTTDVSSKLERDDEPAWRAALAKFECEAEAARAAEEAWRDEVRRIAKAKDDEEEKSGARDESELPARPSCSIAPNKPPRPRVITMDSSTEELQRLLADNPRGLLQIRDELSGWFGSFDRYGGEGADRGFYWNAGTPVPTYPIASSSMAFR